METRDTRQQDTKNNQNRGRDTSTTDTSSSKSRNDNPGNFANDRERASEAGQKGGSR